MKIILIGSVIMGVIVTFVIAYIDKKWEQYQKRKNDGDLI